MIDARELVRKHPKRIGRFVRERFTSKLKNLVSVNWVGYRSGNRMGASIGDGKIYALRLESCDPHGKVLVPNLDIVLAE